MFTFNARLFEYNATSNISFNVLIAFANALPAAVSKLGSTFTEYYWSSGIPRLLCVFGTFVVVVVASLVALIWLRSSVNSGASVSFFCSTAIASSCADSTLYGTVVAFSVESGSEGF